MQRYVALVIEEPGCWTVFFPEFPGVEVSGFPLHMALWRAQRELGARAAMLNALGLEMTAPMIASEIVADPGYRGALPFIIAVSGPREPQGGNVVRLA
jgi:hypothetical protein